jgi:hypothetical protein
VRDGRTADRTVTRDRFNLAQALSFAGTAITFGCSRSPAEDLEMRALMRSVACRPACSPIHPEAARNDLAEPSRDLSRAEVNSKFSLVIRQFFANIKVWFELLKFRHYTR